MPTAPEEGASCPCTETWPQQRGYLVRAGKVSRHITDPEAEENGFTSTVAFCVKTAVATNAVGRFARQHVDALTVFD